MQNNNSILKGKKKRVYSKPNMSDLDPGTQVQMALNVCSKEKEVVTTLIN
jgi:hypothetical protein